MLYPLRKAVRNHLRNNHKLARRLLGYFVRLHNYSYHKISELAGYLHDDIHPKHRITNYHQFFVDNVTADDTVVDLGSGSGFLSYDIAKKARSVTGIEWKEYHVRRASETYALPNLRFIQGDITTYAPERQFDVAVLSNVLEHIEDRAALLQNVRRMSKKLLVRVPMLTRDWLTVYKKEQGFEYRLDETHYIEYTIADLQREAAASGWQVQSYTVNWGEIWAVLV